MQGSLIMRPERSTCEVPEGDDICGKQTVVRSGQPYKNVYGQHTAPCNLCSKHIQRKDPFKQRTLAKGQLDWQEVILPRGVEVVNSYDTGVTLRQLFYRLVSEQLIPNDIKVYGRLSHLSSLARQAGWFPDLIDRNHDIHRPLTFDNPAHAIERAISWYTLDRTRGQEHQVWLGVEKAGLLEQLQSWFGDLGLPIVALGGYASQSYVSEIREAVSWDGRDAILLFAGDFDASGLDLFRDFVKRTDCWAMEPERVALTKDQVDEYDLPINPGKVDEEGNPTDTRADAFIEEHGEYVQVEVDALDPNDLHDLFQSALDEYWDEDAYNEVLEQEEADKEKLRAMTTEVDG